MRGALSLGGRFVPICEMQIRHLQHFVPKRTLAPFAARSLASFKPNWSSLAPAQKTANVPEGEARGREPPPQHEQSQAFTSPPAQAPGQIVPSAENQVRTRSHDPHRRHEILVHLIVSRFVRRCRSALPWNACCRSLTWPSSAASSLPTFSLVSSRRTTTPFSIGT